MGYGGGGMGMGGGMGYGGGGMYGGGMGGGNEVIIVENRGW